MATLLRGYPAQDICQAEAPGPKGGTLTPHLATSSMLLLRITVSCGPTTLLCAVQCGWPMWSLSPPAWEPPGAPGIEGC